MAPPLLLLWCLAQPGANLRGTVVDAQSGEALAQVRVELLASTYQTVTDSRGRFELAGIQPGGYTLRVSTVGYRLARRDFDIAEGETKEFEVVLAPDMFRQTDSVEVRAAPFETLRADPPSELSLVGNELKNLASVLADDPLRSVHALPGVASGDDFNATFSLRGAPYERIGLYLDDVLLHQPFHTVQDRTASGTLTIFNGDMVQDMSLMSGAFPARYGDRSAGALDVRTREGSRSRRSVRATASASNAGLMAEGPLRTDRGSWMASLRKSYLQYIIDRTSEGDDPNLAGGFWDAQARVAYDLASKHNVSLGVFEGMSGLNRRRSRDRLGINSVMLSEYHFTLGTLAWRWTPRERLLWTARAAWTREKYENLNRDRNALGGGHYGEWVGTANASWIWGAQNGLDAGVSLRRRKDSGFANRYQFSPAAVRRLDDWTGNGVISGGYAQQSFHLLGGRIRLTAGGRWDHASDSAATVATPKASLSIQLRGSTRFQAGWGEYVQFPEIQSLNSRTGNPAALPQRSLHALASMEQRFGERSRMRIEFYQRLERDLLFRPFAEPRIVAGRIFNPPLDSPLYSSMRGYARGFEIFFQRRTANRFTGWISYALSYARMRDGLARASFWADDDQRHTVNIYGSYRIRPTVNLSTKWLYGSAFPVPGFFRKQDGAYFLAAQRNAVRLEPYHRADVRLNKAYIFDRWKLTLYAEVVNLFNHANRRYDAFNGYNARTGQAFPGFSKLFPILPSAGVMMEF